MSDATIELFKECLRSDAEHRTSKDLDDTVALLEYYGNRAEDRTKRVLAALGIVLRGATGMQPENHRPLQISLLRYAIDRQAVVYARPPTRWLVDEATGTRQGSKSEQTKLMRLVYQRSRVDMVLRRVDRLANLLQVVLLRVYAVGDRLSVRVFTGDNVRRAPDAAVQTDLARDLCFALKTSGNTWEFWERLHPLADGLPQAPQHQAWSMTLLKWDGSSKGSPQVLQPAVVMGFLPALLVYENEGDEAWPPLRTNRLAATEAINAMANDLWTGTHADTHSTRVWKGVEAHEIPDSRGAGIEVAVPNPNVEVEDLAPRPQIDSSAASMNQEIALYLVSEDLPPDDLDKNKQVVTGAAQRTRLFGLIERRAAQAQMVPGNESGLYRIMRLQWNRLAARLGQPFLAVDTDIAVQLAAIDLPTEANLQVLANEKELALEVKSHIEVVMELRGVGRDEAVQILAQVALDEAETKPNAKEAMTGIQLHEYVDLVVRTAGGELSRQSGAAIIQQGYGLTEEQALAALGPEGFTPPPPPEAKPGPSAFGKTVGDPPEA